MCVYVLRDRYCDAIRVMFDINLKLECFNKRCPKWGSGMKLARYKITFDPSDYCCGKTNRKTKDLFLFFLFSSDDCVYILAIQGKWYRRSLAGERRGFLQSPTKATIRGPLKMHVAEEIEVGDRVCETNLTVFCW